jgi:putative membrane protein
MNDVVAETSPSNEDREEPTAHPHAGVPASRAGRAWLAVAGGIVALVVVLVFVLENLKSVPVGFFGATWRIPLGLDLLLAALLGGVVVFLLGTVRILQLRRVARHRRPLEEPADGGGASGGSGGSSAGRRRLRHQRDGRG